MIISTILGLNIDTSMLQNIAIFSSSLCLIYTLILNIFRVTVFENDDILTSLSEAVLCCGLVTFSYYSDAFPSSTQIATQFLLATASIYYAYRMKLHYVSGVKYSLEELDGKVFIVTGSNTGLGFETAKHIVAMGGIVILACRSPEKGKAAKDLILSSIKCSPTKVFALKLDLCGFDSVRKFVKEFKALGQPLHGLINNAGVMNRDRSLTQDGFEMVFTANHLSHFLLTNLLLPELEKTNGRVVNVTSTLHKTLRSFNFGDVMSERSYSLFGTYAQSKLANLLFTSELQKR